MSDVPEELAPADAAQLPEDWQLLDVRTPEELVEDGRIAGSVHIELTELSERAVELDAERPVLVYCRSGGRSAMAVAALRADGYGAANLAGGLRAWSDAGLPLAQT